MLLVFSARECFPAEAGSRYALEETSAGVPCTWNQVLATAGAINWRVSGPDMLTQAMAYATSQWAAATDTLVFKAADTNQPPYLNPQLPYSINFGEIDVYWLTKWPFGHCIGYSMHTGNAQNQAQTSWGAIYINAQDYTWSLDPFSAPTGGTLNLNAVCLHELGHVLGLGHPDPSTMVGVYGPYDYPTMYSEYGNQEQFLSLDDITGIRILYPTAVPFSPLSITVSPLHKGKWPNSFLFTAVTGNTYTTWDWGDGTGCPSGDSEKHRYRAKGLYKVTATCRGQVATVYVQVGKPKH